MSDPAPPPPPRHYSHNKTASTSSLVTTPGQSFWERAKAGGKSTWDGLYKVSDKVGWWGNRQASKLGIEAFYPTSLDLEVTKAARILRTFTDPNGIGPQALADEKKTQKVLKRIPPSAISKAKGLAIFTVFRSGFVLSGASGSGVVVARRDDGTWGPPSGILLHTIGFGFIFGVDVYDVVLIIRTKKALEAFAHPRITLGAEMTVSAGPVGQGAMLEAGVEASPVWSYVKSKGLYGGVQMDGTIMIERNDENGRSYGGRPTAEEILLTNRVHMPYWAEPLLQTILFSEGKATATNLMPAPISTAEMFEEVHGPPRKLPQEEEDEEDLRARRELEERMREFGIEDGADINRKRQSMDEKMERSTSVPPSTYEGSIASREPPLKEEDEDQRLSISIGSDSPSSSRDRLASLMDEDGSTQMHYLKAFEEPEKPPPSPGSPSSPTFKTPMETHPPNGSFLPPSSPPPPPSLPKRAVPPPLPVRNSIDGPSTPTTSNKKEGEEERLPAYEQGETKEVLPEKSSAASTSTP